ncbi:hypothetical protein OsJ_25706 [Oryza sativa Japonica Group]|uniref:Uncharacterized protein n=1 Tax=Oryza sativa subsp. japonica TaxID=39947 RepID=A3BNR4_ORYSJ|nr:hypothetical protein OsJ_25706 [Oryza sativa Japonica Group]
MPHSPGAKPRVTAVKWPRASWARHSRNNGEAVPGREARHLESARAEFAAMAARASELEAREKDLAVGGQPGGAELARALEQVPEAADAIVSNFEGSAPQFTFGLASDEENGSEDGGDDAGGDDADGEDWDDVVSGADLGGPGTP